MRSYLSLTFGVLMMLPLSAQAQLSKHDQSIANHGYSIPVIVHETPVLSKPGQTLRDDVDRGMTATPPVAVPSPVMTPEVVAPVPSLPPAMPPAKSPEADIEQKTQKKTLETEPDVSVLEILAKNALAEGQKAKDFSLMGASGKTVNLFKELQKGPVVLIWYRGGWCPYCNLQLRSFQKELDTLKAAGAQLIAISPELPDNSMTTAQKNALTFHVLSDTNNAVAQEYGLVYTAPDDLKEKLPGLDLRQHNGTKGRELPLTATYVVDRDATIQYAMITPDYKERAEPADVISVLGDINARESVRKSRIRQAMEREAQKVDHQNQMNIPVQTIPQEKEDMKEKAIQVKGKTVSRVEKLEETVTIKLPDSYTKEIPLKPIVTLPPEGVEPETTLEVRAREEGLIPETY